MVKHFTTLTMKLYDFIGFQPPYCPSDVNISLILKSMKLD